MNDIERISVEAKDNGFTLEYVETTVRGRKWHSEVYEKKSDLIQNVITVLTRLG